MGTFLAAVLARLKENSKNLPITLIPVATNVLVGLKAVAKDLILDDQDVVALLEAAIKDSELAPRGVSVKEGVPGPTVTSLGVENIGCHQTYYRVSITLEERTGTIVCFYKNEDK